MLLATPRSRPLRFAAFAVAAVLLVGVGVATVWGIRGFARSAEWVEHSYQVIAGIDAVETSVRTVESAARGYRLTDRPEQQAEYLAAVPAALAHVAELEALTRGDPAQSGRARELRASVEGRLGELAALVQLQNMQGAEQARLSSMAGVGLGETTRLAGLATRMRAAERALLDASRRETLLRANFLIGFIALGIVLPLALLGLLLAGLVQETRRSRSLEREARQAMRDLEATVVLSDRLSEQRRSLGVYAGLLQSCQSLDEAMTLTASVIAELLPDSGGRCYTLRSSQNMAESTARFGDELIPSEELLQPQDCWALRRGQPHRTGEEHGHVHCPHLRVEPGRPKAWSLCVPLMAQGTSLGLLHVTGPENGNGHDGDIALLEAIGEQLSLAMVNLQLRETLRVQSLRDPLTGLFNRRYLEENLHRELQRCERRGLPLSVLMVDVDHFKRFNDEHGHAAGDALLSRIGQTLQQLTRDEDIACRYGGEEFTVVLPEADAASARRRADEIRAAIGATTVSHLRKTLGPNTASIGVATFPNDGDAPARLLEVADTALYRAKSEGRDRVVSG
ncbi:sensor domain-containing diguanylate cyclase [Lysobacter sp. A3-1-A15]|uniref:sensor domain-containing diguanylate cyclase n=1 Tax=Novilysobacter viscosus TaxID=3098602 RepID=UPI002ED9BBB9